jgi:Putative MetA-pathway of phenol degradation
LKWPVPARARSALPVLLAMLVPVSRAGPPYVSDDPQPTDYRHYEIYAFTEGVRTDEATSGASGIDFNYGAGPDLQLTLVAPLPYERPRDAPSASGFGSIELAAKYRFVHQGSSGWDVAVFPRLFLPSASSAVDQRHASLLLPLWLERDWAGWSTFGGGGCAINHGGNSRNYCLASWALAYQVLPDLQLGAELVYQSPDTRGESGSFSTGAGVRYDLGKTYHLLAYAGPGLSNPGATDRYSWYASILFTF